LCDVERVVSVKLLDIYGRPIYGIAQTIIFLPCGLFLLFFSPNLSGRRLDVCHTSTHGVALVRIKDAGLKRAARGSLKIQHSKNRQKVAIWFLLILMCQQADV